MADTIGESINSTINTVVTTIIDSDITTKSADLAKTVIDTGFSIVTDVLKSIQSMTGTSA